MIALDLFRFNPRLKALTFAIGICVAFTVGSFAFTNGLSTTVNNISDKFVSEGAIAYSGQNLTGSVVDAGSIHTTGKYASVGLCTASVNGSARTFFAVDDPADLLDGEYAPPPGEMYSGKIDPMSGQLEISTEHGNITVTADITYVSNTFPGYWHLISWEDLEKIRPEMDSRVSFMLFDSADKEMLDSLRSQGLTVQEMTGILGFFSAGTSEVTNDLWLIVVPSSFIVALLVYSAIAMETNDRSKDVAILKSMGANRRQIGSIFLFQAATLSVLGAFMGIIIGIIVSYGISTSSSIVISNSLFFLRVTEVSMLIAFASSVTAGILGAALPIIRVSRKSVREALR